jgi:hypothetical protein
MLHVLLSLHWHDTSRLAGLRVEHATAKISVDRHALVCLTLRQRQLVLNIPQHKLRMAYETGLQQEKGW